MKKTTIATSVLVLLSILLSACNLQAASPTQMGPDQINTIAAATVQALTTQMAPPPATATSFPTVPPTATATLAVPTLNLTGIPTLSLSTSTLIPLPTTAGSTECNRVFFVSDETVPDGTVFKPETKFVKSWKIRNDGNCTWTTLYSAIAFSNDPASPVINGEQDTNMKASVTPGGFVIISVNLVAPKEEGTYTQVWKMQDADGKPFGIGGPNGAGWYVNIKVSKSGSPTESAAISLTTVASGPAAPACNTDATYSGTIASSGKADVVTVWKINDAKVDGTISTTSFAAAGGPLPVPALVHKFTASGTYIVELYTSSPHGPNSSTKVNVAVTCP